MDYLKSIEELEEKLRKALFLGSTVTVLISGGTIIFGFGAVGVSAGSYAAIT